MKKIDFHVHCEAALPIEQSRENFRGMMERNGYCGVCIMALNYNSLGDHPHANEDALKVIEGLGESYAFGTLYHDRDFVTQAKALMDQGFSGIKLLEGKPSVYRKYGYGFENPRYEEFFAYAEREQIPLDIHNNDPLKHWDKEKCGARAIEQGWYYDETIPSQQWFYDVLEQQVLAKHPNLRVALAHMGFYAHTLDKAEELMEKYPNLYMDATPAMLIYHELSETPEQSERFFRKYHDRIFYGTDAHNNLVGFNREYNDTKVEMITNFLEGTEPKELGGGIVRPIRLEPYMLENIYYNNAMRFMKK